MKKALIALAAAFIAVFTFAEGESLAETGGFVTTTAQLAFKGITLDDLGTTVFPCANMGGVWIGEAVRGSAAAFCNRTAGTDATGEYVRYEVQFRDGGSAKVVAVKFRQSGGDVTVQAVATGYSTANGAVDIDFTSALTDGRWDVQLATAADADGYGVFGLKLAQPEDFSSINVNFTYANSAELTTSAAAGAPGFAVPGPYWTQKKGVVATYNTVNILGMVDGSYVQSQLPGSTLAISGTSGTYANGTTYAAATDIRYGYIDENENNTTPTVTISNVPFEFYKVVVYSSTDNTDVQFGYVTVNGVGYCSANASKDDTQAYATAEGTQSWGKSSVAGYLEGVNYLVTPVLKATDARTVAVVGHKVAPARGCIAAIQIIDETAHYKEVTVSADKTLSEILSEAGILSDYGKYWVVLTAENNPTITFDVADTQLSRLTVNGAAVLKAADSLYEDGSFSKTLLAGELVADNASFAAIRTGWKGQYVKTDSSVTLYAQNAETISINIGGGGNNTTTVQPSPNDNLVSGSDYAGLYPAPGTAWNNISGHWTGGAQTVTLTGAKAFDGETTIVRNTVSLSGTANNTWTVGTSYESFLRGYLDDSGSVAVQIVGIPYSAYDVIIYATSDSSLALNYFTVNGVNYTCESDGVAVEGTAAWGVGQTTTAALGKNAMLIKNVTGSTLSVTGTRAANYGPRVTVCAVQIVNKGTVEASDWTANLTASTDFDGGNGSGLSDQSGTWTDNALATMIITNTAASATLTFDGDLTAGTFKAVGGEGKCLVLDKGGNANLDITVYDLTETVEETVFNFNPGFDKVSSGGNYVGVGYAYSGNIASPLHFREAGNTLTLTTVSGGKVDIGGSGTLSGTLELLADAEVRISGTYTSQNEQTSLRATKGVLTIAEGADVSVPYVQLVNSSDSSQACTLNIGGRLAVTSTSTSSDVYSERLNFKGILLGHYYGSCAVNVLQGGSLIGENAWLQMTYTAPTALTINGGSVKVRGINGGTYSNANSPLTLTGGGVIEVAEGFVNMGYITRNYGYGTIKTYSYNSSTEWTDPGAITFTDTTNGTTIDPCGMADVFSGALSGAGKIVVSDSVGGGSVSFTGASNNLTGDIVVDSGATLNLGVTRPTGTLTVDGVVSVTLATKVDVPVLKVSAEPASNSIKLYDIDGETEIEANVTYDSVAGTVTVKPPVNTWTVSDDYSFDTAANWTRGLPAKGQDVAINVSGDAMLTVSDTYSAATLTISGQGVVELVGSGAITVETLYLAGGATFAPNSTVAAESIVLNSGTVLRVKDKTEEAVISGAGAVETYGNVVLAAGNKLTGGIIVKAGSALSTSAEPVWENPSTKAVCASGYGPYNKDWAYSAQSRVTVEDGGCVDINNVANKDVGVALTIAGKGILLAGGYSGAVVYTGSSAIGNNSRQISSLTLTADALVDIGMGCGLVHSGHNPACLALNGHTLTVSGSGTVPMVNVNASNSTGMLVLDGANLQLISTACNFTGVDIVAKGCSAIDFAIAPSAIGSLTLKPSASGTTASNWNLPTSCVPVVNTSNVDVSGLADGNAVVLFTDTHESLEYGSNIVWQVGGRFTGGNDAHEVTATYAAGTPQPLLHYDFNNGAAVDTGKASDSKYQISSVGEASSVTLVNSRNGKAVQVHTDYTPYWGGTSFGNSPVHAGEVTVTTVAKLKELGIILWGLGNANDSNTAFGLVAPTANSASVILRNPDGTVATLATIEGTGDLTKGWHFFAVVADANGTTFYVDDLKAASSVPAAAAVGQQGQLGSFHGGAPTGYNKAGTNGDGYYLDDWRVYDAALTAKEVKALKSSLVPDPFIIRFR